MLNESEVFQLQSKKYVIKAITITVKLTIAINLALVSPVNLNFSVLIKFQTYVIIQSFPHDSNIFYIISLASGCQTIIFHFFLAHLFCWDSFILFRFHRASISLFHPFSLEPKSFHIWKTTLWFSKILDFILTLKDKNSAEEFC